MNISDNSNTKRISIDLPEELISRFDQLRKEWGFRARGPVINKLLKELLLEEDLIPKNLQQNIDFNEKQNNNNYSNFHENSALVLIKKNVKEEKINKTSLENISKRNEEVNEKPNLDINLPNFVGKKVKN